MSYTEEQQMAFIAVLCTVLVAAHDQVLLMEHNILFVYTYTLVRVAIGGFFFFSVRAVITTYCPNTAFIPLTSSAMAISHVPFVLAITALDIVLGQPELGMGGDNLSPSPGFDALLMEIIYLADNHIALCIMLSLPRLVPHIWPPEETAKGDETPHAVTLLNSLDPPLQGDLVWIEAQEHYVRITTTEENRLVLARFSDMVRELADQPGMQVHRSHWVAHNAVIRMAKSGQGAMLQMTSGDSVPVSRSYRQRVEAALAKPELH